MRLLGLFISWPFITFIVLLLFRKQIYELMPKLGKGIKTIKTPLGEFEFEPKNVSTVLGKTGMSQVAIKTSNASLVVLDGIQETYVSTNFLISWIKTKWSGDVNSGRIILEKMGLSTDNRKLPIIITKNEIVDNFRPNVNVIVELIGNLSLREYVDFSIKQYQHIGWQIDSSNINEDYNVAFISFLVLNLEPARYQFQRIAIVSGRAYVVTATIAKDTLTSGRIDTISELSDIVNSFRFIV